MTGPDHGRGGPTQPGQLLDGVSHVDVAEISEHSADQSEVHRGDALVHAGVRSVADHDLHAVQSGRTRRVLGVSGKLRVEFDQPGPHVVATCMVGQHAEQVTALAGAHAQHADLPRWLTVQRLPDAPLDEGEAPAQGRPRDVVLPVPADPMTLRSEAIHETRP